MLIKKIEEAFNKQLNAEIYSAYLYLSMAAFFESNNLKGMAKWMKVQAQEEMTHAMKFFDYLHDRGAKVTLTTIEGPQTTWKNSLEVFEESYKHECHVTSLIYNLVELSQNEKDYASIAFLQWFVKEQVEEEASVLEIVEKLKLIKDHAGALMMIDRELGSR